ncbi:hypothetical protein pb186bvf_009218 [Paramecium bursaria]
MMQRVTERVKQYPLIKQAFTFSFLALVSAASGITQTQDLSAITPYYYLNIELIGEYILAAFLIKKYNRHAFVIGYLLQLIIFIVITFTEINKSDTYGRYAFLIGSWSNFQIGVLLQAAFILFFEQKIYQMIFLQILIEDNFIYRVKEFLAEKDVPSITNIFASFYVIAIFIAIVYIQRKMHLKEPEQKEKQNEYLSFRTSNRKKLLIYFVLFITIILCLCCVMLNQTDPQMAKNKDSCKVYSEERLITPFVLISTLFIPYDKLYTLQAILLVVITGYWIYFQFSISYEVASNFYLFGNIVFRNIARMIQMNYIIGFMQNSGYINPITISCVIKLSLKFYRFFENLDFLLGIKSVEQFLQIKQIESNILFFLALITGFLFLRQLKKNKDDHLPFIQNAEEEITKKPEDYQLYI